MENRYLDDLISSFASLPTIGKKTAKRLAYYILNLPKEEVFRFTEAIMNGTEKLSLCQKCFNLTENLECSICQNIKRKDSVVLVVENFPDIFQFEEMGDYQGKYFVLGGLINPLEGVSPSNLRFPQLLNLIENNNVKEVILGINQSSEGDTTSLYIKHLLKDYDIQIYKLAKGMPQGSEIEYTDRYTLQEALKNKQPF